MRRRSYILDPRDTSAEQAPLATDRWHGGDFRPFGAAVGGSTIAVNPSGRVDWAFPASGQSTWLDGSGVYWPLRGADGAQLVYAPSAPVLLARCARLVIPSAGNGVRYRFGFLHIPIASGWTPTVGTGVACGVNFDAGVPAMTRSTVITGTLADSVDASPVAGTVEDELTLVVAEFSGAAVGLRPNGVYNTGDFFPMGSAGFSPPGSPATRQLFAYLMAWRTGASVGAQSLSLDVRYGFLRGAR